MTESRAAVIRQSNIHEKKSVTCDNTAYCRHWYGALRKPFDPAACTTQTQEADMQNFLPVLGLGIWSGIILYFHITSGWVPILDSANLAFHEAGHPIFGMLSSRLCVYGGTLMQLLMPGLCAFEMYRQRKYISYHFCLIWIAENMLNIARYMADARAHELPLVGGLDPDDAHDWTIILQRWHLLSADIALANCVRVLAVALMAWALWRTWQQSEELP